MGGRVVEGTGLENRQTRKRLEGSNPSPSAITLLTFLENISAKVTSTLARSAGATSNWHPFGTHTLRVMFSALRFSHSWPKDRVNRCRRRLISFVKQVSIDAEGDGRARMSDAKL